MAADTVPQASRPVVATTSRDFSFNTLLLLIILGLVAWYIFFRPQQDARWIYSARTIPITVDTNTNINSVAAQVAKIAATPEGSCTIGYTELVTIVVAPGDASASQPEAQRPYAVVVCKTPYTPSP